MNIFIRKAIPHFAAIVVFLLACAVYFSPQLQGKVPQQSDIVQYRGMSQEVREFYEQTGERSLWTNAMFGGMPTYQINTVSEGNNLKLLDRIGSLAIQPPIGRFFIAMISFYILMVVLGVNSWLSIIGAIAFGTQILPATTTLPILAVAALRLGVLGTALTGVVVALPVTVTIWPRLSELPPPEAPAAAAVGAPRSSCFMPRLMRSFSVSTSSTIALTTSPLR